MNWDGTQGKTAISKKKNLEDETGLAWSLPPALQRQAQPQCEKMDRTGYPDQCNSPGQGGDEKQKLCLASQRKLSLEPWKTWSTYTCDIQVEHKHLYLR